MSRKLSDIAVEIRKDWRPPNFAAVPYINALAQLSLVSDKFGADTGRSLIIYFLSNAASWKGLVARKIKKELNAMLKAKVLKEDSLYFDITPKKKIRVSRRKLASFSTKETRAGKLLNKIDIEV